MLPEGGRVGDVVLLPLLERIIQGDVQRRVTNVLAADHDAAEQRLGSGHPVVVVGAGLFLHGAAQLHVGRGEPQSGAFALVKVRHGTLCKVDRRQLRRLQVRPVDGQRRRCRFHAKHPGQFRAEIAAQLLLQQRFFLRLGGLCHQQEQRHTNKYKSADQDNIALHKHQDAAGHNAEYPQQHADALRFLAASQFFRQLGICQLLCLSLHITPAFL